MEVVESKSGEVNKESEEKNQGKPTYEQLENFALQSQKEMKRLYEENQNIKNHLKAIAQDKLEFLIGASIDILKLDVYSKDSDFEDRVYSNLVYLYEHGVNSHIDAIRRESELREKEEEQGNEG